MFELSPEDAEVELERELAALEASDRQSESRPAAPGSASSSSSRQSSLSIGDHADLSTLHANLRERLRGFLAQKIEGRHVRVTVTDARSERTLSSGLLLTAADGTFRHTLPIGVPPGEAWEGRRLLIRAELQLEAAEQTGSNTAEHTLSDQVELEAFPARSIRIVSDLDDTVKRTDVLAGTRTILRNVFTRPYDGVSPASPATYGADAAAEVCVDGMREWYTAMSDVDGHRSAFQCALMLALDASDREQLRQQ